MNQFTLRKRMLCTDYDKIVLCCWYFVSWLFLAMVPAVLIKEVQRCWDEGDGGGWNLHLQYNAMGKWD